ncbi:MAG: hypothetical protein ABWK00_01885 [Desulfurococcaceae archaeon]
MYGPLVFGALVAIGAIAALAIAPLAIALYYFVGNPACVTLSVVNVTQAGENVNVTVEITNCSPIALGDVAVRAGNSTLYFGDVAGSVRRSFLLSPSDLAALNGGLELDAKIGGLYALHVAIRRAGA